MQGLIDQLFVRKSTRRQSMVAISARVALLRGSRVVGEVPLMIPAPTAHWIGSRAYSEIRLRSLEP